MKIAIIGLGKMGQAIKEIAIAQNHEVVAEVSNYNILINSNLNDAEVAIEFTEPASAFKNIKWLLEAGIPVVSGTTGWLSKKGEIDHICEKTNGSLLYASNFSLGMNITFLMNEKLAQLCSHFEKIKVQIEETHHVHKLDAPSGTAKTLAKGMNEYYSISDNSILSHRVGEVVGKHSVEYSFEREKIILTHEATNRQVFASGAVMAAKWLLDKKGVFDFRDILLEKF